MNGWKVGLCIVCSVDRTEKSVFLHHWNNHNHGTIRHEHTRTDASLDYGSMLEPAIDSSSRDVASSESVTLSPALC